MLKLENGYSIYTSKKCFILVYDTGRINSKNESVLIKKGYYSKIEQALSGYSQLVLLEHIGNNDLNLSGLMEKIDELKKEIASYNCVEAIHAKASGNSVEMIEDDEEDCEEE